MLHVTWYSGITVTRRLWDCDFLRFHFFFENLWRPSFFIVGFFQGYGKVCGILTYRLRGSNFHQFITHSVFKLVMFYFLIGLQVSFQFLLCEKVPYYSFQSARLWGLPTSYAFCNFKIRFGPTWNQNLFIFKTFHTLWLDSRQCGYGGFYFFYYTLFTFLLFIQYCYFWF